MKIVQYCYDNRFYVWVGVDICSRNIEALAQSFFLITKIIAKIIFKYSIFTFNK